MGGHRDAGPRRERDGEPRQGADRASPSVDPGRTLTDLVGVLWQERQLLEDLDYRLACEGLALEGGHRQLIPRAELEVRALLDELTVVELRRATLSEDLGGQLSLGAGAALIDIAASVQPPWSGVLHDHRAALLALTRRLEDRASGNRALLRRISDDDAADPVPSPPAGHGG